MTFTKLLLPSAIKVQATVSSKKRLLHDIAELAHQAYSLPVARTVEALLERESLGPTGVGHGVALPHARAPEISEVCGCFILLEKPIDYEAIDRQPVDLVFALFAPENAGVEHLKALALVSRTLRDQSICRKLRSNPDPATQYTILTESQSSQAA